VTSGTSSKKPPRVYVHQPFWYLLTPFSPVPLTASAMKIPENTAEDPHSAYGDIQREYSSDFGEQSF